MSKLKRNFNRGASEKLSGALIFHRGQTRRGRLVVRRVFAQSFEAAGQARLDAELKQRFTSPMARKRDTILAELIERHGLAAIAAVCGGITPQAVSDWSRVPPHHVIAVEALSGMPREVIRPDIFGAPRPRPQMNRAVA